MVHIHLLGPYTEKKKIRIIVDTRKGAVIILKFEKI